jgi:hypothetical protein
MPASDRRYCVLGIEWANNPGVPELLAVEGKIVVFDTLTNARDSAERLAAGREYFWTGNNEVIYYSPLSLNGCNKISVWRNYDPFDTPVGMARLGIRSEAEGRDWKFHCHWMGQVYSPNFSKDVLVLDVLFAEAGRWATEAFGDSDVLARSKVVAA